MQHCVVKPRWRHNWLIKDFNFTQECLRTLTLAAQDSQLSLFFTSIVSSSLVECLKHFLHFFTTSPFTWAFEDVFTGNTYSFKKSQAEVKPLSRVEILKTLHRPNPNPFNGENTNVSSNCYGLWRARRTVLQWLVYSLLEIKRKVCSNRLSCLVPQTFASPYACRFHLNLE